jgi:pseudo-rSAM protein
LQELEPDSLTFLIQRDEEIPVLEGVIEDLHTGNISVQPYFNGSNLDFFKKNVFIDHESLSENILDIGVIKARTSQNTLNYGKMFIRSNQNIYSNLNGTPLGKIGEISMETAVISELTEHGNWLRVRRNVAPCGDCLLNSICPPLSNFEYASGINNSCNIRKDHRTSI